MISITVRGVSPAMHRALEMRAKKHFRSMNSEILALLAQELTDEVPSDDLERQADAIYKDTGGP